MQEEEPDLYSMYGLYISSISHGAGTVFALALLFSSISEGIVVTMTG
jgi:metal iron transporter